MLQLSSKNVILNAAYNVCCVSSETRWSSMLSQQSARASFLNFNVAQAKTGSKSSQADRDAKIQYLQVRRCFCHAY